MIHNVLDYTYNVFRRIGRIMVRTYTYLLDIIFPLDPEIKTLESMSVADFFDRAERLAKGREIPDAIIVFEYQHQLVKKALTEAKFRGNRRIARLIGEAVKDVLIAELSDLSAFRGIENPIIVPIPMTRRALRQRGHDQCLLLLAPIIESAHELGIKVQPDGLTKVRETGDQVGRTKQDRLQSLALSFEANPDIVRGRSVIVFDDIVTTGATWSEAKRALRSAGARHTILLAVAH